MQRQPRVYPNHQAHAQANPVLGVSGPQVLPP